MEEKDRPIIHKKKRVLTIRSLETKLAAIADVEAGLLPKVNIARKYDIPPNTLSTWIKNADRIKAASHTADFRPDRKKLRTTPYDDIDRALYEWYVNARSVDVTLTYKQLQARADQIAEEMGYQNFRCSNGWVHRFKDRYNLINLQKDDALGKGALEARLEDIDPLYYDTMEEDEHGVVELSDDDEEEGVEGEEEEGEEEEEEELIYELVPVNDMNGQQLCLPEEEVKSLGTLTFPNRSVCDSEPCETWTIKQEPSAPNNTSVISDNKQPKHIVQNPTHKPPRIKQERSDSPGSDHDMPLLENQLEINLVNNRARSRKRPMSPNVQDNIDNTAKRKKTNSVRPSASATTKTKKTTYDKLKIAIIGQSQFGAEVYKLLKHDQHKIVGVFTIPDKEGRADPLAQVAEEDGVTVYKFPRWRTKGKPLPDVLEKYKEVGADLNVMPFCSQFIPMEVIQFPKHESIIYHPSILPRHRGASAINWTLMQGDPKAGFTIFWADDGLDTGPILLQRETDVEPNDIVDTVYNRFLYPEGIKAMAEAVQMIGDGVAPRIVQPEEGATYDPIMKKDKALLDWKLSGQDVHNWIRGNDKVPGAWTNLGGEKVTLYGSRILTGAVPSGTEVEVEGMSRKAVVHNDGMAFFGSDGVAVNVAQLQFESGKMIKAGKYGQEEENVDVEFTAEEQGMADSVKAIWVGILSNPNITPETDFFKSGAGSMEVVRLVEEVKDKTGVSLTNEDVYMATTLDDFTKAVVLMHRGGGVKKEFTYDAVEMDVNNMTIRFPNQVFINNEFMDASDGNTFQTINPATNEVICKVGKATKDDVNRAVAAAKGAFEGSWGNMNPRDRGTIMFKLADLMDECKEELATLESIDSGAVYTLALKTHIGMSVDTFRYMAGWCDKIHGSTIPINQARPNRNLTYTKREPIGVCGIVTPWNYPLMMLAWKMSACLAAGNTVVLKPAQVTPLTSLKFCELAVKAGFPPGVINVLPGSGTVVGQGIADHPDVRKLGFTGSTPIGKVIMESCARSNLKKVSLELGGKSPLIVFSDCDLDRAVRFGMSSVFFNKGENCIAAGRLFIEEDIHDEYVERILAEVKKMKIGNPLDRSTDHGPQNHKAHLDSLVDYCKKGVEDGATLVYGGMQVDMPGLFFHPTVFTDVTDEMFIAKEESFGPVMVISKFKSGDVDEVIRRANDTEYGLASGVFTKDISKALHVADKIQAGTCFINTYNKTDVAAPFGGFKQSGFGKDLGEEALNEYLKTKCVTVEY